jgi:hypothetical protein
MIGAHNPELVVVVFLHSLRGEGFYCPSIEGYGDVGSVLDSL